MLCKDCAKKGECVMLCDAAQAELDGVSAGEYGLRGAQARSGADAAEIATAWTLRAWLDELRAEGRVLEILNDLTPLQARCVDLRYRHGRQQRDIARELGISQQAVSKHCIAAKRRLRKMYCEG